MRRRTSPRPGRESAPPRSRGRRALGIERRPPFNAAPPPVARYKHNAALRIALPGWPRSFGERRRAPCTGEQRTHGRVDVTMRASPARLQRRDEVGRCSRTKCSCDDAYGEGRAPEHRNRSTYWWFARRGICPRLAQDAAEVAAKRWTFDLRPRHRPAHRRARTRGGRDDAFNPRAVYSSSWWRSRRPSPAFGKRRHRSRRPRVFAKTTGVKASFAPLGVRRAARRRRADG